MHISIMGLGVLVVFISLMFLAIMIGHKIGVRKSNTAGLGVTEGAVFTLMALLLAFTFSGANQRFDQRRTMVIEEVNAIGTAFLRLDLLQPSDRALLKNEFLTYLTARIAIYEAVPDFAAVDAAVNQSIKIQGTLWRDVVKASLNAPNPTTSMLIIPAINNMFDIAHKRVTQAYYHAPFVIFVLLLVVTLLSAVLTGYATGGKSSWLSVPIVVFVLIISITIYITMDLEFPRIGLLKETQYDYQLYDLKNAMLESK